MAGSLPPMRVIAGTFGGRTLRTADGMTTRPTTDKVRQAVFNSLDSAGLIDGAVVADLYAGCGAVGIEALSRGAAQCTFVERDRDALQALSTNIATLAIDDRATVVATDVMAWVGALRSADIVFADPPYEFDGWPSLQSLIQAPLLIAESDQSVEAAPGWEQQRTRRYGRTWVTVLQRLT
jgi:16S rRNA (guanine966-N2)-methyltransferase